MGDFYVDFCCFCFCFCFYFNSILFHLLPFIIIPIILCRLAYGIKPIARQPANVCECILNLKMIWNNLISFDNFFFFFNKPKPSVTMDITNLFKISETWYNSCNNTHFIHSNFEGIYFLFIHVGVYVILIENFI